VSVIGEGDELIVPEPNYNTYNDSLRFARGVKVGVPTYPQENFHVNPERMAQAITERTRALLLVSPNNPSAGVIPPEDVHTLVKLAEEHDLLIIADDIYDLFVYDDYQHLTPSAAPGGKERTLTLNALSKAYSMTGWRTGWIVGPADLMAQVKELKAAVSGGASLVAQHAALAALNSPPEVLAETHATYAYRRQLVLDAMDSMGISYGMPQGGQFIFADISFTGMDSISLAQKILSEEHVLAYPGSAFAKGWDEYLRITFLQPEDKLREGLERMKRAMDKILAEN
jgi:aminotransferase